MAPPLLFLKDTHLTFGGTPLLTGAEIAVGAGDRLALVGRNGSGKSTFMKIAAGLVEADRGERFLQPGTTVRYLPQEPDLSAFATTLAYVEAGLGPGDDPYRARYLLESLGLTGDETTATLSGGEARRAALARVLAPEPDLLLLDEPTNHLDLPAIEWLEAELKATRSALVLISHDRRFLENLSRATVWLDRGRTRRMEKGFAHFEGWREEVLAEEERERQRLDAKILREEDWLRYGVSARRTRNQRRLAELHEMRRKRRETPKRQDEARLVAAEAESSGKLVFEAKRISKSYAGRPIVSEFSTRILRGDRLAMVGPNGAGKTTLLKLLTGELAPDTGSVRFGTNLVTVTLDQKREDLHADWTLAEALTDGRGDQVVVNGEARHVVTWMKDFLFRPEQKGTPVGVLSGGERARLMLARALAKPANVLVLDEPTNDLDLETLDLLQELIADHPGTVLLVSHDRDFLDRVATSTVMCEGDGRWVEYAGGYSDMVAQRGSGVAARKVEKPAEKPKAAGAPAAPREAKEAKRRLTMAEMHALKTLPGEIETLGREVAKLAAAMADPAFYARDPKVVADTGKRLDAAQAKLHAAEEEWLRLEMLKEELGG